MDLNIVNYKQQMKTKELTIINDGIKQNKIDHDEEKIFYPNWNHKLINVCWKCLQLRRKNLILRKLNLKIF